MQFTVTGFNAFNSSAYKNKLPRSVKERMVTSYEFELYPVDCPGGVTINGVDYTAKKGCFSLTKPGWRQRLRLRYNFRNNTTHLDNTLTVGEILSEHPILKPLIEDERESEYKQLRTWIQEGYISELEPELKSWLDGEKDFEVVDILCYEWYYE